MKESKQISQGFIRWKHFSNKTYSTFNSLNKQVNIGVLAFATLAFANIQDSFAQQPAQEIFNYELEEIEVTGSRVALTQSESARMVTVLSKADIQAAAVHSINDLLKFATNVDVRQRGEFGIQTDISIRGGTFDQITVLLNGVNLSNPQTGHLTTDFPVSIDDIERIEILSGPAARVYGTSAFNGAINIITKKDTQSNITAGVMAGSYGLVGGNLSTSIHHKNFNHRISGNMNRSDGAQTNSDFVTAKTFYQGDYTSDLVNLNWQFGFSDQQYGANTFYSAKYNNQYEKNRRYITSVQAETKGWFKFMPTVYWIRSYDNFQLIRDTSTGENFHQTDVYGANLNASMHTVLGKTAFGVELRNEGILSTNLGKPLTEENQIKIKRGKGRYYDRKDNRTNVSYYLEHNVILNQFTLSLGALANMNTSLDHKFRFYPGVDLSYRPSKNWKLYGSWNKALRMPTFTDLYYQSPTQEGNTNLKPEKTQAFNLGAKWQYDFIQLDGSAFYHKGKQMIDWVMYDSNDVYHSANFKLDNRGVEMNSRIDLTKLTHKNIWLQTINLGYSYIDQKRYDDVDIYKSNYALSYLKHKFIAQLSHQLFWKKLLFNWSFRWQNRMGDYLDFSDSTEPNGLIKAYPKFALVDLKVQWTEKNYLIYFEANNLLNRTYFDLGNVPQPGLWVKGGIKYRFNFK